MIYKVRYYEVLTDVYEVPAESEEEAIDILRERLEDGEEESPMFFYSEDYEVINEEGEKQNERRKAMKIEDFKQRIKDHLEDAINDAFEELQIENGIQSGDVSPELAVKLENLIDDIAGEINLIISCQMNNE